MSSVQPVSSGLITSAVAKQCLLASLDLSSAISFYAIASWSTLSSDILYGFRGLNQK
jgi:hypothetical protein